MIEIARQKDRLDALFKRVGDIEDIEMQSHWAKYLCVLVSGFVETSVQSLLIAYAEEKSTPQVARYVSQRIKRLQNVKTEKLLTLFGDFNQAWREELDIMMNDEIRNAINSVVDYRNNIAHGQHVGLTYTRVHNWYKNSLDLIKYIEDDLVV